MERKGFTTIELIITLSIIALVFSFGTFSLHQAQKKLSINASSSIVMNAVTTAARRARSGSNESAWGAYFDYDDVSRTGSQITLFSGDSYALRDTTRDIFYKIGDSVVFQNVSLSGGLPSTGDDHQIVFTSLSGETDQYGTITVESYNEQYIISISEEGIISKGF